jgi:hypothetical protein
MFYVLFEMWGLWFRTRYLSRSICRTIAFVSPQDSVVDFGLIEHGPATNIANRDFQGVFSIVLGDNTLVNIL